jgi:hypothetical protein
MQFEEPRISFSQLLEMGSPNSEGTMEGWLYLIRSNRFGQHYSRKRYFILKENVLRSFKNKPTSQMEVNYHIISKVLFFCLLKNLFSCFGFCLIYFFFLSFTTGLIWFGVNSGISVFSLLLIAMNEWFYFKVLVLPYLICCVHNNFRDVFDLFM